MRKRILFIANSLDNAYKFQQLFSSFDADVSACSTLQIRRLKTSGGDFDLVVFEARGTALACLGEIKALVEDRQCALLVIVEQRDIELLRLPYRPPCDFVIHGASANECALRIRRLLDIRFPDASAEIVSVGSMIVNMSTYQVTVAGDPVDFTYLEYALLAFLVNHPNHTFSRDALLQSVWGFDYRGGSRTVDVHVRRIRAKIGPDLAQCLETVRGVGYLWRPR